MVASSPIYATWYARHTDWLERLAGGRAAKPLWMLLISATRLRWLYGSGRAIRQGRERFGRRNGEPTIQPTQSALHGLN